MYQTVRYAPSLQCYRILYLSMYFPLLTDYVYMLPCYYLFQLVENSSTVCWFLEKAMASLQYSSLENPMDGGAWWAAVHGVAEGWTRLSDFTLTFHFHALEKEMATHSSVLAWRIPGTGEPGGLLSVGSYRVGHDWSDLAAAVLVSAIQ